MPSLNQLLINDDFVALSSTLKKQNIFDMLNVGDRETIHSRFLGYLLDPNATHGLGTAFLECFLLCLSIYTEGGKIPEIPVSSLDLDMANVTCEWSAKGETAQRIDVIIVIPYKTRGRLIIAIECKLKAAQSPGQLASYDEILKKEFAEESSKRQVHRIFLTRYEEAPESNEWSAVLWQDLVSKALNVTITKSGTDLSPKVQHLLCDYKSVISSWSDESDTQDVEELCQRLSDYAELLKDEKNAAALYLRAKHREAYESLSDYFSRDERKNLLPVFSAALKQKEFHESDSNNKHFRFWPASLAKHPLSPELSPFPSRWTKDRLPMLFEIEVDKSRGSDDLRSKLFLQFGPMGDQYLDERYKLITALRVAFESDDNWKTSKKKEIGSKWARIVDLKPGFVGIAKESAPEIFSAYFEAAAGIVEKVEEIVRRFPAFNKESSDALQ